MTEVASQVDISKALAINGWMSERELIWLATQAKKCRTIVEFGSFQGRSTRALADNMAGCLWAIDPWNGDYADECGNDLVGINTYCMPVFLTNLKEYVGTFRVFPVRGFSHSFSLPFQVDMVFIDGDHRYDAVVKDINKAIELVKPGGIISGHDYDHPLWHGVKNAVDKMLSNVEVEDTIWYTVKS